MRPAKRGRLEQEVVVFFRPHEPNGLFSNWSKHGFTENGVRFPTAEHFLMHAKAVEMGDEDVARLVLAAKSPREAKSLGRRVKPWDEARWTYIREDVMGTALLMKARQNPEVREALRATDGKTIAEASPYDAVWGIGLSGKDPRAQSPETWLGENLLGKAWMSVRDELFGKKE